MFDVSSGYHFQTFSVGAIIKPSIIERDDCIRSQYKLRGIDSIKTDITKELAKVFSKKTKHVVDYRNPEFTFTMNFKDESCQIHSKSITLSGEQTLQFWRFQPLAVKQDAVQVLNMLRPGLVRLPILLFLVLRHLPPALMLKEHTGLGKRWMAPSIASAT